MRHNRQAVTGAAASLHNLRSGIVDTLVLVDDYVQEPGWNCGESLIEEVQSSLDLAVTRVAQRCMRTVQRRTGVTARNYST